MLPDIESVSFIEGDYQGYIFNMKEKMQEVFILKDNKLYSFTLIGFHYTQEQLNELFATLVI